MPAKETIHVQQGVWIDQHWLQLAGLGTHVKIEFIPGEIRIQSATDLADEKRPSQKGWNTLSTLGDDAEDGCLDNASENHDRFLYGKRS
ncbi:MAG: hypothetical protein AB7S77_13865 [Desulfatirhabdiaceae bacterium]